MEIFHLNIMYGIRECGGVGEGSAFLLENLRALCSQPYEGVRSWLFQEKHLGKRSGTEGRDIHKSVVLVSRKSQKHPLP